MRTELLSQEIVVESLGGDTLEIEVSALKKIGLDKLLEAIALQAEVLELTANPNRPAEGVIVEAKLERGRGPVGTALIQRGTLHLGDLVVAGSAYGRVRALINELGEQVDKRRPFGTGRGARLRTQRRRPATSSPSSRTRRAPARSPITACASGASAWPWQVSAAASSK